MDYGTANAIAEACDFITDYCSRGLKVADPWTRSNQCLQPGR